MASRASIRRPAPSAPDAGRRERRRRETRERIFRAALKLFAQHGFVATTVEDITEAADVGKGTFFNYFPSKEHVLAAFSEMQFGKLAAVVSPEHAPGKPLPLVLRGVVHALAEEPSRSPALVRAILVANLTSAPVRHLVLGNMKRGIELLSGFFAMAQKQGQIRQDLEPIHLARGMQQMFFGTLFLWTLDPSESLQQRLDRSLALFLSATATGRARRPS